MTSDIEESLGDNIKILNQREHAKASEKYVDVIFNYENHIKWEGSVPIHYRRTGIEANTKEEIIEVLKDAYGWMHYSKTDAWYGMGVGES